MTARPIAFAYRPETHHDFERALALEWLETDGLGGWAASTVSGAHSRRYHGLLVAATRPPVGRTVLLSKLDETVRLDAASGGGGGEVFELGANRFPGAVHPRGFGYLNAFRREIFPVFEYQAGPVRLEKTIVGLDGESTTLVLYRVLAAPGPFTLELRPFVAGRDYHSLTHANDAIHRDAEFARGVLRHRPYPGLPELFLAVPGAEFAPAPDWWRRFTYEVERERGLDFEEDLFTPGVVSVRLGPPGVEGTGAEEGEAPDRLGVIASTTEPADRDAFALAAGERRRREGVLAALPRLGAEDDLTATLGLALDQFVVRRGEELRTVIAGYPWFGDWGRDTMISLPGLAAAGRLDDAGKILRAFAAAASRGMLPNRFPDSGEEPEYNTVDATLWMFVAVRAYLAAGGDEALVRDELLPVLRDVVSWHDRGTRYGIRVASDGLLAAGAPGVQLTWMDAKVGDWVVTPRQGKPVEVNALWYNALQILGELERRLGGPDGQGDTAAAEALAERARRVWRRFGDAFWNEDRGCLHDVLDPDGEPDPSIRPNQLFALSLPHPLLGRDRALRVLAAVEEHLLTPVGLRSLAPSDPRYRPVYRGGVAERDGAYHQGTVWAWLLGPYVDALLRFRGAAGLDQARAVVEGIRAHLAEAGIGSISEIFDAEPPHPPRGCPAQAWSVAELLRARLAVLAAQAAAASAGAPKSAAAERAGAPESAETEGAGEPKAAAAEEPAPELAVRR